MKDKKSLLGFQLGYWLWPGRLQATGKYSFSYADQQRFKQNIFQINLLFLTNVLTGNKKIEPAPVT